MKNCAPCFEHWGAKNVVKTAGLCNTFMNIVQLLRHHTRKEEENKSLYSGQHNSVYINIFLEIPPFLRVQAWLAQDEPYWYHRRTILVHGFLLSVFGLCGQLCVELCREKLFTSSVRSWSWEREDLPLPRSLPVAAPHFYMLPTWCDSLVLHRDYRPVIVRQNVDRLQWFRILPRSTKFCRRHATIRSSQGKVVGECSRFLWKQILQYIEIASLWGIF